MGLDEIKPVRIHTARGALRLVLGNNLENALNCTRSGGEVGARPATECVHVFDPFYRTPGGSAARAADLDSPRRDPHQRRPDNGFRYRLRANGQLIPGRYRHFHANIRVTDEKVIDMKTKLHQTAAVTTLLLAGLGGGALAAGTAQNDALGINDAGISLTQAIAAAEQQVGGKASKAEYEDEDGRAVFEVEVLKGNEVMDVQVDPADGTVLASAQDKPDQGEDEEHEGRDADD